MSFPFDYLPKNPRPLDLHLPSPTSFWYHGKPKIPWPEDCTIQKQVFANRTSFPHARYQYNQFIAGLFLLPFCPSRPSVWHFAIHGHISLGTPLNQLIGNGLDLQWISDRGLRIGVAMDRMEHNLFTIILIFRHFADAAHRVFWSMDNFQFSSGT